MIIIENEDDDTAITHRLDLQKLRGGLRKFFNIPQRWHWENFMNENDDAETGDVFLQITLLGEIKYG